MADISVIIPVYNVKNYLKKCLNSIISQVYKDIEILLIDDGSDDGSSDLCDTYALKDSRIRVIHMEHAGLSCARNTGINVSKAPYIMFLDADDWVDNRFCDRALHRAKVLDADIVFFRRVIIDERGRKEENKIHLLSGTIPKIEAFRYILNYTSVVWIGLYKRELFDTIRFPEGKYYEDVAITHRLVHRAERVGFENFVLYYYRKGRKDSITNNPLTKNMDLYEMHMSRFNDLYQWGYKNLLMNEAMTLMIWYGRKGIQDRRVLRLFQSSVMNPPHNIILKKKIMLALYRLSPDLFDVVCIISGRRRRR